MLGCGSLKVKILAISLLFLMVLVACFQIPVASASPDIYLKDSPASGVAVNPGKLMDFKAPTKTDPDYLTTSSGIEYYWYSPPYVGTIPGPKAHSFHLYYEADAPTTITVRVYLAVQPDGSGTPSLVSSKTCALEAASTITHVKIADVIVIPETKLNGERIKLSLSTEDPVTVYFDSIATPSILNTLPPPPPPPPINSGWTSTPPTIDGVFGTDEWANAQLELTLPYFPIHALVYIGNDASHLYSCVDAADAAYGDYTPDLGDYCALVFDVGNDGVWTAGVDTFFVLMGSGVLGHYLASDVPPGYSHHCDASEGLHPGLAGAIGFGTSPNAPSDDHRIYEFRIPLNMIGASPGSRVGFSSPWGLDSLPYDAHAPTRHNVWPYDATLNDLSGWGDIVLASAAVGGIMIPVAKAEILTPWIAVALAAVVLAAFAVKRRRE